MLIPSIDLLDGKVVQLVQGERKALEFDSPEAWIERFQHFPIVQLIDLDAAMRTPRGHNRDLLQHVASRLPVQVGGGIRTPAQAQSLLNIGARKVIIGSALFGEGAPDLDIARAFQDAIPETKLIFSVDSKAGQVAIAGWKQTLPLTPAAAIRALDPFCGAFLYTHIDTEGTLTGFPLHRAKELRSTTSRPLIVAGGIRDVHEIAQLHTIGVDAVVGMAIYSGLIQTAADSQLSDPV